LPRDSSDRYVLGTKSVDAAIAALEQARELARAADDPVSEFAVSIDLGNAVDVHDIDRGLGILREALSLYEARLAALGAEHSELARLHGRLVAFIGIGEFDRGDLGQAKDLLDASIAELDALGRRDDFPRILNYRAQIELAAGQFDRAAEDLQRALEKTPETSGPWASYNRALLGKVYLEEGEVDRAGEEIRTAWSAVQANWQVRLGTVVRQYLVEYLLREGSSADEFAEAADLLAAQVADSETSGFLNLLAAAHSLRAEVELRQGRPADAVTESARAVEILGKSGALPIVRSEEVLWRHSRCLSAAGQEGADKYAAKARQIVERKASSLRAPQRREQMLRATPVARALGLSV
jgi:tetratricopeptide (TPR) repeat protein